MGYKYRQKGRTPQIDANQPEIVRELLKIPGVTVEENKDDILVGYEGRTFWIEIKNPEYCLTAKGKLNSKCLKDPQKKLLDTWAGHYAVCWDIDQILAEIGAKN